LLRGKTISNKEKKVYDFDNRVRRGAKGFAATVDMFKNLKELILQNISQYSKYVRIHESYQVSML
jgi:hypothetical protein